MSDYPVFIDGEPDPVTELLKDERIIFHHIPKSGGISMVQSLRNAGLRHTRIPFNLSVEEAAALVEQEKPEAISSHWYTKDLPGLRYTWVRHPIDVFYSGLNMYMYANDTFSNGRKITPGYRPEATAEIIHTWQQDHDDHREVIDRILDHEWPEEDVFPNPWFLKHDWDSYDFIGRQWLYRKDLDRLGRMIGKPLGMVVRNVGPSYDISYRYREIRRYFAEALEEFDYACTQAGRDLR